jgi:predicted metalloprotease
MRWSGRRQSTNIEDRRGRTAKGVAGVGGVGLVIAIIYVLVTGDVGALQGQIGPALQSSPTLSPEQEARHKEFVAVTLADTEEVWGALFSQSGERYQPPTLVLFSGSVESACGFASAAVGPFYCGEDMKAYLDFSFFDQMESQLGAGGDFARAYVIAHEIGHHVQNLLGTLDQVHARRSRMGETEANALSVRLELQADFYAGVWAHHAREMAALDEADIREAMNAASAIGDDTLQKRGQGYVVPDAFTHGTSEQRTRWFMKGYRTGDPSQGDTFSARSL